MKYLLLLSILAWGDITSVHAMEKTTQSEEKAGTARSKVLKMYTDLYGNCKGLPANEEQKLNEIEPRVKALLKDIPENDDLREVLKKEIQQLHDLCLTRQALLDDQLDLDQEGEKFTSYLTKLFTVIKNPQSLRDLGLNAVRKNVEEEKAKEKLPNEVYEDLKKKG